MVEGKTESGFKYSVNPKKLQDVRFLRAYKKMIRDDDATDIVDIVPMVLGEDQAQALFTHCEKDGVATIDDVAKEFAEICQALTSESETKN